MQHVSVHRRVPANLPHQNLQSGMDTIRIFVVSGNIYAFVSCAAVPDYNPGLVEHKHYDLKELFGPLSAISVSHQVFLFVDIAFNSFILIKFSLKSVAKSPWPSNSAREKA